MGLDLSPAIDQPVTWEALRLSVPLCPCVKWDDGHPPSQGDNEISTSCV